MVKRKSLFLIIFLFAFAFNCFSQTTVTEPQTESAASFENNTEYFSDSNGSENSSDVYKSSSAAKMIIKMIVVLALVIAALYGIMHFFKKKNNVVQSDDDFLRRVSTLNLAPGKSIEIVTLVDKGYVLGVTDGSINLISEITDKEMISALNVNFDKKQNTKKPMNFNEVLEMFLPLGKKSEKNIYQTEKKESATEDEEK